MGYYSDYYRADVREAVALTPNMIRIVFGGPALDGFEAGCTENIVSVWR